MKVPTDIAILRLIYKLYYEEFNNYGSGAEIENGRGSKIYVPIDCVLVARHLKMDADIVFGRLYYHLQNKYGFAQANNAKVPFFSHVIGQDRHCIHFPLLASVLAGLEEESSKSQRATIFSIVAIVISVLTPIIGWLTKT